MQVVLSPRAFEEFRFWQKTGQKKILKKIEDLLLSVQNNLYEGIGHPEPLKHHLSGAWSRRIDGEHRLVYELLEDKLYIHSVRGHY